MLSKVVTNEKTQRINWVQNNLCKVKNKLQDWVEESFGGKGTIKEGNLSTSLSLALSLGPGLLFGKGKFL